MRPGEATPLIVRFEETLFDKAYSNRRIKTLFFYYSGHCDASDLKLGASENLAISSLGKMLTRYIEESQTLLKLIIVFDCCFAPCMDRILGSVKTKAGKYPTIIQINATKPSIEASLPEKTDASGGTNSYFTKFLIQCLTLEVDKRQKCIRNVLTCDICEEVRNFFTKTDYIKITELYSYIDDHMRLESLERTTHDIDWKPTLSMSSMDRDNANIAYRYVKQVDIKFCMHCPERDPFEERLHSKVTFEDARSQLFTCLLGKNMFNSCQLHSVFLANVNFPVFD